MARRNGNDDNGPAESGASTGGASLTAEERDRLIRAGDEHLLRELDLTFTRSSGPGGQHRNKAETAVRLVHRGAGVTASATERRSQHENRKRALRRMRAALALEVRAAPAAGGAVPRDVTALLQSARWPRLSPKSRGYWPLAARVLDRLAADGARLSDTAKALGVSTGSLVKFLATDTQLWQVAQRMRDRAGLKPLRR